MSLLSKALLSVKRKALELSEEQNIKSNQDKENEEDESNQIDLNKPKKVLSADDYYKLYEPIINEIVILAEYSKHLETIQEEIPDQNKTEYELESRLGTYDVSTKKFESGVSEDFFNALFKSLNQAKCWDEDLMNSNDKDKQKEEGDKKEKEKEKEKEKTRDNITVNKIKKREWIVTTELYYHNSIRRIIQGRGDDENNNNNQKSARSSVYQYKQTLKSSTFNVLNRHYDIRVGVKQESNIKLPSLEFLTSRGGPNYVRIKSRFSFISSKCGFRVDFTKVFAAASEPEALLLKEPTSYEVEVEYIAIKNHKINIDITSKQRALAIFCNTINLLNASKPLHIQIVQKKHKK